MKSYVLRGSKSTPQVRAILNNLSSALAGFMWLVFLFWVTNMIMLTTMAVPSIVPKSGKNEGYAD